MAAIRMHIYWQSRLVESVRRKVRGRKLERTAPREPVWFVDHQMLSYYRATCGDARFTRIQCTLTIQTGVSSPVEGDHIIDSLISRVVLECSPGAS